MVNASRNQAYASTARARVAPFVRAPTPAGAVKVAVPNDTCGNLIQLVETPADG